MSSSSRPAHAAPFFFPLHHALVVRLGHVETQEHPVRLAGIGAFDLVNLVLEDETLAAERLVEDVTRIVDLDRPAVALLGPHPPAQG